MRKQIYGLSNLVRAELERDPQDGDLYLFRNRRKDMIKILFYDHGGFCLLAKRLDKGTFTIEVDEREGIATSSCRRRLLRLFSSMHESCRNVREPLEAKDLAC